MKLPRDISGQQLTSLFRKYGYRITRQTGSHIRLPSDARGTEHHVTIPAHRHLKVGTLSSILADVAAYLEISREDLAKDFFGK